MHSDQILSPLRFLLATEWSPMTTAPFGDREAEAQQAEPLYHSSFHFGLVPRSVLFFFFLSEL